METHCTGICRIDPDTRVCEGCHRTIDEISNWATMTDSARATLIATLSKRAQQGQTE